MFIRLAAAEKGSIRAAQNIIQQSTCIKFRRTFDRIKIKDYVNIKPGSGCASTVGFLGGEQIIYIQKSVENFFQLFCWSFSFHDFIAGMHGRKFSVNLVMIFKHFSLD